MSVRDFLSSARKHLVWVIMPLIILSAGVGVLSMREPKVYRSSASLYVTLSVGNTASELNQGSNYTQSQMLSFGQLATMPIVLDPVIGELDLSMTARQLGRTVSATTPQDTSILDIAVTGTSAEEVARRADAIALELADVITQIAPTDDQGNSRVRATLVDQADVPMAAISPNTKRNVVVAAFAGLLLGLLAAYLRDALDTRVKRPEDVDAAAAVPVLGSISGGRRTRAERAAWPVDLLGSQAEEFRRVRANLQMIGRVDETQLFVFSSAVPGEGKSHTTTKVALSLAAAGARVLVIDADLRRPTIAHYFGLEGGAGLTECLIGRATFDEVRQEVGEHLTVLASGAIPPNPSELLSSRAFEELLLSTASTFDVVLIDAPPLLPVADAVVISRRVTGLILIADVTRVRRAQLSQAAEAVRMGGGRVVGVILNRTVTVAEEVYAYSSAPRRDTARRKGAVPSPAADESRRAGV